jgi:hypothetical protein
VESRYREYTEKIKTGSVLEIAKVLRDLFVLKGDKELSFGERKMLDTARNLLVKELAIAKSHQRREDHGGAAHDLRELTVPPACLAEARGRRVDPPGPRVFGERVVQAAARKPCRSRRHAEVAETLQLGDDASRLGVDEERSSRRRDLDAAIASWRRTRSSRVRARRTRLRGRRPRRALARDRVP